MWQSEALQHAIESKPKESCGLLIIKKEKKYIFHVRI